MASAILEAILQRLLVPDNNVIQQATKDLKEAFKDPNIVAALCECLAASESPQVRQYASVLLRRKLAKLWKKMSSEMKESIKQLILAALCKETEHPVRRNIAQLVAMVAINELSAGRWNKVYTFIEISSVSSNSAEREVALLLLSNIMYSAPEIFEAKITSLLTLFLDTLQDETNKRIPYYTIKCMIALVDFIEADDHLTLYRSLIPMVLQVLRILVVNDDDYACEAMELFHDLLNDAVAILAPLLSSVVEFLIEVAKSGNVGDVVRAEAFCLLARVVRKRKQAISPQNVLSTVLSTALAAVDSGRDGEDDDDNDVDEDSDIDPPALALLDSLATNLDSAIFYPLLVQMVQPWFIGGNPKQLKAAILSMAWTSEGCSKYILEHGQLRALLECVYSGLQHSAGEVRYASLVAIKKLSTSLQPDIRKYAGSIIPVLLDNLLKVGTAFASLDRANCSLNQAFDALDFYCENLEESIVPFLPTIVDKLVQVYTLAQGLAIKEGIVFSIGVVANEAEDKFLPYFPQAVKILDECLSLESQSNTVVLHANVILTLTTLAKRLGRNNFLPLVPNCVLIGKNGMKSEDPDLRGEVYNMFAALSSILKEEMAADLHVIITTMLAALQTDKDIKVHYSESGSVGKLFDSFDDIDSDDNADLHDQAKSYTFESSYIEEKTIACIALGHIADNTGVAFLPHFTCVFRGLIFHLDHPAEAVRTAAAYSLGQVGMAGLDLWEQLSRRDSVKLTTLVKETVEELIAAARSDIGKDPAGWGLDSLSAILRYCKGRVQLEATTAKTIMRGIQTFLKKEAECQDESEEDSDGDDEFGTTDQELIWFAGAAIPPLVALVGPTHFIKNVEAFIASLLMPLKTFDSAVSDRERSHSIQTLANLLDAMGSEYSMQYTQILEVFFSHTADKNSKVRANAIFGVGVLASHAHPVLSSRCYGTVLQRLFALVEQESEVSCKDHFVVAICRMIVANHDCVPLDQVVPALLRKLPLSEPKTKYKAAYKSQCKTVYRCFSGLVQLKHSSVLNSLTPILQMFADDFSKLDWEAKLYIEKTLLFLSQNCAAEVQLACAGLSQDQVRVLTSVLG